MRKLPNPIDVHVGARVRQRRVGLGLSQERLGEQLGLTFQQVQKYEKGVNRIGASRLFEISGLLTVPVQYFFEDMPDDGSGASADGDDAHGDRAALEQFMRSTEAYELCRSYSRIESDAVRESVLRLIKNLSSQDSVS